MGTDEPFGTAVRGLKNHFEVFHDEQHPSHITLPTL
ncbi:hypothetical protein SAMN05421748_10897 [Paractinoplanes atraurantiacus]|uniref:Uncharacterized protein n=1 Tax=Paractinoplanes atraurantiacus TaxID=1036182 RepID=A0A285IH12_9ACTN|nr:hypothetical protein SAMN05421748_10897 [Actinoplanes atraurantiacus]